MDFARSNDPAVQRQLDRLSLLSPGRDVLGLERVTALLKRLGNPEQRLPPVFHVAGTNGKGSTCAFLRGCIEAAGLTAHVYTSPHLVRFNERIRVAGRLIENEALASVLEEVLRASEGLGASFFEVSTACAFLEFSRTRADATVLEVGLGGRLDATNVVPIPAACGIAALGIDHQSFLGETLADIAGEKAGIARSGVPLVTLAYTPDAEGAVEAAISSTGATRLKLGEAWNVDGRRYSDRHGTIMIPELKLAGAHQLQNAGLALAMLRHQSEIVFPTDAFMTGLAQAEWPARLQRLRPGPLVDSRDVWLDGGHNPSAAEAIALALDSRKFDVIVGMLANKNAPAFLRLLRPIARSLVAIPVADHEHHDPAYLQGIGAELDLPARTARSLREALEIAGDPVLITGSLYLAGEALAANGEPPQ